MNLRHSRSAHSLIVVTTQQPVHSCGKVVSLSEVSHIAVLPVIYHFRYATRAESHTRHAACHRLHDCVGQIVLYRRQHIYVGSIVYYGYPLIVAYISQGARFEREASRHILRLAAEHSHHRTLLHLRMVCHEPVHSLDEILHTLAAVGHAVRHEENHLLVLRQSRLPTAFRLVAPTEEHTSVDGVRDAHYALSLEQRTLPRLTLEPPAASHKAYVSC